jgi:hypothetical protein
MISANAFIGVIVPTAIFFIIGFYAIIKYYQKTGYFDQEKTSKENTTSDYISKALNNDSGEENTEIIDEGVKSPESDFLEGEK